MEERDYCGRTSVPKRKRTSLTNVQSTHRGHPSSKLYVIHQRWYTEKREDVLTIMRIVCVWSHFHFVSSQYRLEVTCTPYSLFICKLTPSGTLKSQGLQWYTQPLREIRSKLPVWLGLHFEVILYHHREFLF